MSLNMSNSRLGGTRTRLNRYASDASDRGSSDFYSSSSTLNGTTSPSPDAIGTTGSTTPNTNNSSSGLYMNSYASVGRTESFGRSAVESVTDGTSYSSLGTQRQLSGGTTGRFSSLSDRVSPPVISDQFRVSN